MSDLDDRERPREFETWDYWEHLTDEDKDELLRKLVSHNFLYSEIGEILDIRFIDYGRG